MKKLSSKKLLPYIIGVLLFIVLSLVYFPSQIEGKKLAQHDKKTFIGGANEISQYQKETGEHSLWTNSMFGGMPSYLVSSYSPNNINAFFTSILDLGHKLRPASFIFMLMLGFFIALLLFGVDPWLSVAGAIFYGFSSYFFIIIEAGHLSKVQALAFLPTIIAGIYYTYKKNRITGAVVTTLFLSVQIYINHLQITYYTLILVLLYLVFEIINTIKEKSYSNFIKSSVFLFIGVILAVMTNFTKIITTYSYGKDSIRGKSELTDNQHNKTSGLDKDYATAWSYGKLETLNLLIPDLMGGASTGELSRDSHTYKKLKQLGVPNADKIIKSMPLYWGPQPFTSGPVYIGAIVIFLFVMGMFLVKGSLKWWLFTATLLSVFLAWGKNFMFLTDIFLDYFPMYNKFRTVSMILVIAEFTIPLLGVLALKNIIEEKVNKKNILKALKYSLIITGGLILLLLIPGILSFKSNADAQIFQNWPKDLVSAFEKDRASLFRSDALRSLIFILIGAGLIWAFVRGKIKKELFIALLGLAVLIDLFAVDKRYLNSDDFVSARKEKQPFVESTADKFILKDKEKDYRVMNLTVSTFNDASTSYFHKSIGGYHGAKLRRYQDLIDRVLQKEIAYLINTLQQKDLTEFKIKSVLAQLSGINMMNTKYIIVDPGTLPIMNEFRLGNAWFVDEIKEVDNADEEIKAVQSFNPERTAIVDKKFNNQFFKFYKDSASTINLTEYKPNYLSYESNTQSNQLAVFSEIYYAKGWKAFIDGKPVPHFRADYVLRAMKIPAGKHKIEFKFEPEVWKTGNTVSQAGSILMIIAILVFSFYYIRKNKNKKEIETE